MIRGLYRLKPYKDRKLISVANWLFRHQVKANYITISGLINGLCAALCILQHQSFWGILFILISIFADLLDGTVARLEKKDSLSGKLLDSVSDRLVESALVGALISTNILPLWGWVLPFGSVILLLNRFWSYRLGIETSFIVVARFERMIAILGVMLLPWRWFSISLYLIVTGGILISNILIIKRIIQRRNDQFKINYINISKND